MAEIDRLTYAVVTKSRNITRSDRSHQNTNNNALDEDDDEKDQRRTAKKPTKDGNQFNRALWEEWDISN